MDEYDQLLLSAVHNGNVEAMQTCLSSMQDPNVYLNRIYDQPNEQKCTLLTIACLNGHEDIIYMLLDCFQPNLEVLNVIRIHNKDRKLELYQDVTVLWAAAAVNHFLIVKRLVEHGARVNHTTNTNSTSVRCACYSGNIEMVRYLVEHGADINITKNNHETNLSLSVFCKHLQVSAYLVDELGCNVNECDEDGRSALYFAVKCGSLEMVQFLLNRGARNFPPTCDRMSPLMLAADRRRCNLVEEISLHCSLLEWIEAEELLGSSFACAEHGLCDLQQTFEHFSRALKLRTIHRLPKLRRKSADDIFKNRQECRTIEELEAIRANSQHMHLEALLVRERLLGPASDEYRYSVVYRGAILADSGQYDQAIVLWMYEFALGRQYGIPIVPEDMRQFVALFSDMVHHEFPIPIDTLLTIVRTTIGEVMSKIDKIDYNLHTLLFLVTITSQPVVFERMSPVDRQSFYRLLSSFNQGQYKTREDGYSLLHLSLHDLTAASHQFIDHICEYPCLLTVRTLLHCGFDLHATDISGNTPLHVFVSNLNTCDEAILQLLCEAGVHIDYANILGQTAIDVAFNDQTKQLLKSKMNINLKCLCARLIRKTKISFYEKLSLSLVKFVQIH